MPELFQHQSENGVTLLEMLVAIAVIAILAVIAVPSYQVLIVSQRLVTDSNRFIGIVGFARAEAIRQGKVTYLTAVNGADWAQGMTVWVDEDGDDAQDSSEVINSETGFHEASRLVSVGNLVQIRFNPDGMASATDTLQLCQAGGGSEGRAFTLLGSGILRMSENEQC